MEASGVIGVRFPYQVLLGWLALQLVNIHRVSNQMSVTYQDKYQIVAASNLKSKSDHLVVNRVNKSDDGYAQENRYFFFSAKSLTDVIFLVDCFLEPTAILDLV